jgi:hypothetical protein
MSSPLAQAFCLKNGRRNFQINVRSSPEDRQIYFGRGNLNQELVANIRQRYAMGVPPKKYLYGLYGAGKTHTLFNLKYQLEESPQAAASPYKVRCRIMDCEFRRKTDFSYVHGKVMEAISLEEVRDIVRRFLAANAMSNVIELLREKFENSNVAKAIHSLALGASDVTLWKWLCAGKLSATELTSLGLTKNLDTVEEMVTTQVGLGRLFQAESKHYLFLLDEMEGLRNLDDADAQESFHDGLRKLASEENDALGFMVSIFAGAENQIPDFVFRPDIISRINRSNIHLLNYLQEPREVEQFLRDLFDLMVDPAKKQAAETAGEIPAGLPWYPLTDTAKEQFVDTAVSAVTASLPRNLIKAVNECAVEAVQRGQRVIDVADLNPARQIFQEEVM